MRAAGLFNSGGVPAKERINVREALSDRHLVALSLIALVPLVVIVEDQRNDIVEAVDEFVRSRRIDEVKPAVKIRKVMIAAIYKGETRVELDGVPDNHRRVPVAGKRDRHGSSYPPNGCALV